MELNKVYQIKDSLSPLYRGGDKVKVIKINSNQDLMPLEVYHFRSKEVYGFYEEELIEIK